MRQSEGLIKGEDPPGAFLKQAYQSREELEHTGEIISDKHLIDIVIDGLTYKWSCSDKEQCRTGSGLQFKGDRDENA